MTLLTPESKEQSPNKGVVGERGDASAGERGAGLGAWQFSKEVPVRGAAGR